MQPSRPLRPWHPEALRLLPVTTSLLAINLVFFGLEALWGGTESSSTLVRMGAVVIGEPIPFRLETLLAYGYLHVGIAHVAINMLSFWNLGTFLEPLLGSARLFVVYTLAILGGGLAIRLFGGRSFTAGASGGLFGLLGVVAVLLFLRARTTKSPYEREVIRRQLLGLVVPNAVISLLPGVSFLGHAGGFVVGVVFVALELVRARGRSPRSPTSDRIMLVLATILALTTALAIASLWLDYRPWEGAIGSATRAI